MPTEVSSGNQEAVQSVSQSYLVLPPGLTGAFDPNILISAGYGLQVNYDEYYTKINIYKLSNVL